MRLDLEKIINEASKNAFILDLNYTLTTRDELDQSFEKFFATFSRNPARLIAIMNSAVRKHTKRKTLEVLSTTTLTQQDKENFEPFTLQDLMPVNKIKKNGTTKNESID